MGEAREYDGNGERYRLATVVAETEPFFRDVMGVYVDLLCRGDRNASRMLFRSGVRFAAAVHGLQRTTGNGAAARSRTAAREHLERCLFALWTAEQRRLARAAAGAGEEAGRDTGPLFERGLAMLAVLREEPALPSWNSHAEAGNGPVLSAPPE